MGQARAIFNASSIVETARRKYPAIASLDSAKTPSVTHFPPPAAHNLPLLHERLRAEVQPALVQAIHPGIEIRHHPLQLGGRKSLAPVGAADKQQILIGGILGVRIWAWIGLVRSVGVHEETGNGVMAGV
jgi:hypothetical protein